MQCIQNLKRSWYLFRRSYYCLLLEGCLDTELRQELIRKIEYHEMKLSA